MKSWNHQQILELLDTMAADIRDALGPSVTEHVMIGLQTGGLWIADQLHRKLALDTELCSINISFYLDDFTRIGLHPKIGPSHIPETVEDKRIILVDDVLFTGRTVRAAMNEIFDYGRPGRIALAVLVERGGRELPIAADYSALKVRLQPGEEIKLSGPDPLALNVIRT